MRRLSIALVLVLALLPAAAARAAAKWPVPPAWFLPKITCIGLHESHNGHDRNAGGNLYGMLAGWGQAGGVGDPGRASPAEQLYRTWVLYRWSLRNFGDGWLPWPTRADCGL